MAAPVPCCCLVPQEAAASLEPGGAVAWLCQEAGAELRISTEEDTPPALADRIVTIRGSSDAKEAACREVVRATHLAQGVQETPEGGAGIFVLAVPESATGFIIGPKGSTISGLIEATRAEVSISRQCIAGTQLQPISVAGGMVQTVAAAGRINALLQQLADRGRLQPEAWPLPQARGRSGGRGTRKAAASSSSRSATPTGRGMRERSREPQAPRAVVLVGSDAAARLGGIEGIRQVGDGRLEAAAAGLERICAAVRELRLVVPATATGFLRGRAGNEVLRDVESGSGAELELEEGGKEVLLAVSGGRREMSEAARMVLERLEAVPAAKEGKGRGEAQPAAVVPPAALAPPAAVAPPTAAAAPTRRRSHSRGRSGEAAMLKALLAGPDPKGAQLRLALPADFALSAEELAGVGRRSGSRLELAGPEHGERLLTVTGSMLGNSMAVLYIQELMLQARA